MLNFAASPDAVAFAYLAAGIAFILALRGLSHPETARRGLLAGVLGMAIALLAALAEAPPQSLGAWAMIAAAVAIGATVGLAVARSVAMTAMPQLVAAFHSLVGLAAVFVAAAALQAPQAFGILNPKGEIYTASLVEMSLGAAIGAITFSGSIVAFAKLQGLVASAPLLLPRRHDINAALAVTALGIALAFVFEPSPLAFWTLALLALVLGALLIIPIGGADMPVVVSMLNSYSGWAAAGIGFTIGNSALIITGALVGASGAILSYIMCKGMNRPFLSVILGGFGGDDALASQTDHHEKPVKRGDPADAAFLLANAENVIVVPGYGMAVAQAQHALRETADALKTKGVNVVYAVHPVAGRMPGHMNVLLAEAGIPYDEIFELEDVNADFPTADAVLVIGANDVTNPAAKEDPASPIYGMPVLEVWKATSVLFVKRGLATGYAGIDNNLFYRDNTMMIFGDAKKVAENIAKAL